MKILGPFKPFVRITSLLALISGGCLSHTHAVVIVEETFGGLASAALNGTTADTFDGAISTAGGSSTWVARADSVQFNADGSITPAGVPMDSHI